MEQNHFSYLLTFTCVFLEGTDSELSSPTADKKWKPLQYTQMHVGLSEGNLSYLPSGQAWCFALDSVHDEMCLNATLFFILSFKSKVALHFRTSVKALWCYFCAHSYKSSHSLWEPVPG